jgi:hypothetical protein
MDQQTHEPVDPDLKKGAVEGVLDRPNTPLRDEPAPPKKADDKKVNAQKKDDQNRFKKAVEITKNVKNADPADVATAEDVLGADRNGTPG